MKKLSVLLSLFLCACVSSSVVVGSGHEASGEFTISMNYSSLSVSSGISVVLVHSESGRGTITADEKVLKLVSIVENGGRVTVSYEPLVTVSSSVPTVVHLPLSTALAEIDASSAARVSSSSRILTSAPKFEVDASSAARVEIDLDATELSVDLSSAASFGGNISVQRADFDMSSAASASLEGHVDVCRVDVSSAASFRGTALVCRKAQVAASSSASVEIYASGELVADASSGGLIRYTGSPAIISRNTSSGGSVSEIRL